MFLYFTKSKTILFRFIFPRFVSGTRHKIQGNYENEWLKFVIKFTRVKSFYSLLFFVWFIIEIKLTFQRPIKRLYIQGNYVFATPMVYNFLDYILFATWLCDWVWLALWSKRFFWFGNIWFLLLLLDFIQFREVNVFLGSLEATLYASFPSGRNLFK